MSGLLTIVMYHYVRDLARSKFPRIRGLTVEGFRHQLDYIDRFYTVVRMEDLVSSLAGERDLPPNGLLLTFDDGFRDHVETVHPMLKERGWQGSFFPCVQPLAERRVLDVHKIHFVLATVDDPGRLLRELDELIASAAATGGVLERPEVSEVHRYDEAAVTTFKRLLQRDLPPSVRTAMVDHFFRKYVTENEAGFADQLYASVDDLRKMRDEGMYVGCHGYSHVWFDHLSEGDLENELTRSLSFLADEGLGNGPRVMCYPYGGYNQRLRPIMHGFNCSAGLLASPGIADLTSDHPLELPRLDTNDLPQQPQTEPAEWTRRILETA